MSRIIDYCVYMTREETLALRKGTESTMEHPVLAGLRGAELTTEDAKTDRSGKVQTDNRKN